jgi:hypothetical protein
MPAVRSANVSLAYRVTFGERGANYSIYIPGKNNNVILSRYEIGADAVASWVNLRFGKCRAVP